MSKLLGCYEASEEVFYTTLYKYEGNVEVCDLKDYICGYKPKNIIKYNGKDTLICREYILSNWMDKKQLEECTTWKQVIVRKVVNADVPLKKSITGTHAWNYMYNEIFRKEYTKEEIEEILSSHEEEESNIYHYNPQSWMKTGVIEKIDNCEYYDINSAYCDALCELFPKCKDVLNKMYKARKEKPVNKDYFNFFCGYLCVDKIGHRKTFNWITHRTRNKLVDKMNYTGGDILYANTDGFIVTNPKNKIYNSKELGAFKNEYSGTVYLYKDKNYTIMQYGDKMKGSALCEVRKYIDLSKGDVVHYKCKIHPYNYRYAEDIIKENLYEKNGN